MEQLCEATESVRGSTAFSSAGASEPDKCCTITKCMHALLGRVVTHRGTQTALEERVMGKGEGKQDREVHGNGGALASSSRSVPEAIIKGGKGAGEPPDTYSGARPFLVRSSLSGSLGPNS